MVRTQIQLTEAQADALRHEATARGVSMAEVVRRAVDAHLTSGHARDLRARAVGSIGGAHSGRSDIARNHDAYLYDEDGEG